MKCSSVSAVCMVLLWVYIEIVEDQNCNERYAGLAPQKPKDKIDLISFSIHNSNAVNLGYS